jgi:hypothetical protein
VSLKNHRVLKKNEDLLIHLNIPEDCIYDISYLILQYKPDKSIEIISEDIPSQIKKNMLNFYKKDLNDFINLIESNFEIFLSGNTPSCDKDIVIDKDGITKLSENYVFPINKLPLNNLKIEMNRKNVLFFSCKSPNFEMQCNKCKINKNVQSTALCNCGIDLKTNYIPTLDSEYLGSIFPDYCTFICFNPSKFQFNCEKCNTNYESNTLGLNSKFVMNCWECDTQISFLIKKLIFIQKKSQVFKKGEELPEKGTCKHYKKSYRWFRFPCCGSVYPCDVCHDLESNHESKLANKMICGLCSKEQSVKKDCDCGMTLKKNTNCWEGGKGNRNKVTMNKKDKKKYK